jgi:hypothetical protein
LTFIVIAEVRLNLQTLKVTTREEDFLSLKHEKETGKEKRDPDLDYNDRIVICIYIPHHRIEGKQTTGPSSWLCTQIVPRYIHCRNEFWHNIAININWIIISM